MRVGKDEIEGVKEERLGHGRAMAGWKAGKDDDNIEIDGV